jgi:hypothetical protein
MRGRIWTEGLSEQIAEEKVRTEGNLENYTPRNHNLFSSPTKL